MKAGTSTATTDIKSATEPAAGGPTGVPGTADAEPAHRCKESATYSTCGNCVGGPGERPRCLLLVGPHRLFVEALVTSLGLHEGWVTHAAVLQEVSQRVAELAPGMVVLIVGPGEGTEASAAIAAVRFVDREVPVALLDAGSVGGLPGGLLDVPGLTGELPTWASAAGPLRAWRELSTGAGEGCQVGEQAQVGNAEGARRGGGGGRVAAGEGSASSEARPGHGRLRGNSFPKLTGREREVVRLVSAGVALGLAADRLGVSAETARTHLHSSMTKLGVHSRAELASVARRLWPEGLADVRGKDQAR